MTCFGYSNMGAFHLKRTTSSWETTSIEVVFEYLPPYLLNSRKTIFGDDMLVVGIQDKISGELLFIAWESRMCQHKSHLRILRW